MGEPRKHRFEFRIRSHEEVSQETKEHTKERGEGRGYYIGGTLEWILVRKVSQT